MPCVFLVIRSFIIVREQKQGLDQRNAVRFVVKVVKQLKPSQREVRLGRGKFNRIFRTLVFWKKSFRASLRDM